MIVGDEIVAAEGYVLAVRILEDKSTYNTVEDLTGRMVVAPRRATCSPARWAPAARCAAMPASCRASIAVGDTIEVLNLGGILGRCTSVNPDIGPPFQAEVLGAVLAFPELGDRVGPARPHPRTARSRRPTRWRAAVPVVYVAGTCMNAGKTVAATELVRGLARGGLRVAAAKLTGVSLMRDALSMLDAGAVAALTFNDVGIASTHAGRHRRHRQGHLQPAGRRRKPDVIVAELGDGILGEYGVQDILRDAELTRVGAAYVMAAPDPVACWGAAELMQPRVRPARSPCITGPATDNEVGQDLHHRRARPPGAQRAARRRRAGRRGARRSGRLVERLSRRPASPAAARCSAAR